MYPSDSHSSSDGVHKRLLDAVEDHDAKREDHYHKDEAVDEPTPADEFATTEESVLEGFYDGSDRVDTHQRMDSNTVPRHTVGLTQRINNRRGVHPQLHDEGEENLQVTILGSHGRDNDAKA